MSLTNDDVWFSGPVKDAISLVNERNCVFLVYIHDDSEKTNSLNSTLKDEKVTKVIEDKTVALAMKKGSENASLFSQFYPVQAIPVLYFIKQGTIRDFGTETITSEEIIDKINSLSGSRTVSPSPTAPSRNQVQESRNQVPAMPPQVYTTSDPDPIQDHNATELASPDKPPDVSQSEQSKKAKLQKQLEKIRKERAERERNEAKEREIIRRQEAKMIQEARQSQQEKENKIYFAQIKKERLENEAHRKKVKEQIARDRAEKIAQRNAERQRHQQQASSSSTEYTVKATSSNSTYSTHSNLSIRQLDGSNIRHQFEATATLSNIKDWIDNHRTDNGRKPYKLYSQFPARLFTEEEDTMTLEELNLCPSATIIMKLLKPTRSSSSFLSSNSNGTTSDNQSNIIVRSTLSVLDFIYGLIVALLNLFSSALGTLFPTNGLAHQENASSQQQQSTRAFRHLRGGQRLGGEPITTAGESSSTNTRRNDHDQESSQRRLNNNNPYATRIKTLHEEDEEEDEKNKKRPTYNGNSVNQE